MQTMPFAEIAESLAAKDPRYSAEAYSYLRDVLDAAIKHLRKNRKADVNHVTAGELLEAFRVHTLREFGPMATTVLEYWGIRSCEDIGNIVFNLVDAGVFGRTEQDTIEAFREGFDFHTAFVEPFLPDAPKPNVPPPPAVAQPE